jgi:hypothetical protein
MHLSRLEMFMEWSESHVPDTLQDVLYVAEHAVIGGREIQIRRILWAESEDGKPHTISIYLNLG